MGMIDLGMMDVLLEKVKRVFGKEDDVADAAEMMLWILESIVEQMYLCLRTSKISIDEDRCELSAEDTKMAIDQEPGTGNVSVSTEAGISQMAMFLDKLASPLVRNNPKVTKTMTRIIPFLTYGNERFVLRLYSLI